jgi:hypothetical protein
MSTGTKTLFVVLLYMVLALGCAVAATSGTLVIRAYVPEIQEIEMRTTASVQKLDLTEGGGTALVGTVKERSTKETGYNVTIASKNATDASSDSPYLAGLNADERMDYHILYGGEAVELRSGSATVGHSADYHDGQILVGYDSVGSGQPSGYSDTLTLSVIAN